MAKIDAFFKLMNDQGASDLHLIAGQQPALRIRGDIERVKYNVLENNALRSMLYEITPEDKIKVFDTYTRREIKNLDRECNLGKKMSGFACTMKAHPFNEDILMVCFDAGVNILYDLRQLKVL